MPNYRVDITVSGKDAASPALKSAKEALKSLSDAAKAAGVGAAAFIGTFKTAMDIGAQGAAVNQTAESFQYLLDKIGAAPDMLDQLREASMGTVDDMTLMSSTATLLAGVSDEMAKSLAATAPQILEIAKAANKLNPSLGDTNYLYSSLMTGIKRGSPLLIDNTGLTLKLGKANEEAAKALGKTVEQLTAEEQKQALLNAVLEAGGQLMEQVGGSAESQTDSFARLDTATKNLGDTLKGWLAPGLANAAEAAEILLTASGKIEDALEKQTAQAKNTSQSYREYLEMMTAGLVATGKMSKEDQALIYEMQVQAKLVDVLTRQHGELTEAKIVNFVATGQLSEVEGQLLLDILAQGGAVEELVGQYGLWTEAMWKAAYAGRNASKDFSDVGVKVKQLEQDSKPAAEGVAGIGKEAKKAGDSLGYAAKKTDDWLSALDTGIANTIKGMIDELDFKKHGGDKLQQLTADIKAAMIAGSLSEDEGRALLAEAYIAAQGLEVELGNINLYEAAQNIRENLGVPFGEALQMVKDIQKITSQAATWKIYVQFIQGVLDSQGLDSPIWTSTQAAGGAVTGGQPYVWNEPGAGPEILVPAGNGFILNRPQAEEALAGGGGGGDVYYYEESIEINNHDEGSAALTNAMVMEQRLSRLRATIGR